MKVFTGVVDRNGGRGRTERFVSIEVHVSDELVDMDWDLVDGRGQKDLRQHAKGVEIEAVAGVARIAWKSVSDRAACVADHMASKTRQRRWRDVLKSVERMRRGEFPQFAHAYLHPSLTGRDGLTVIDGTRRMLAYLECRLSEMPVVVFRAARSSSESP